MVNIIYTLFIVIYVFFLPGFLFIRLGLNKKSPAQTLALSFGLSICLVPIISFGIALLLHTTMQKNLILATVTLINSACLIMLLRKYNKGN